ncbi:uncharacterized protein EV422DRAFT_532246 [Fimicolochytrium jonesii]|uniref:uncharacterized protein n=1 Tax=Fimicolochytrium jonesii TaxID=1396493 RepID=UPI0022FDFC77|nr:uncharacterized protein EV422DRAFT_532246 [Fimicolochytrium jonesii]KAI8820273.1 hypothetical protein EV422DRAFT_532246 [Fimicolochytrium jonesii]
MTGRDTAAVVVGYAALVFWSFQLLPQVLKSFRAKSTGGLSATMMFLWAIWTPFFAAYALYSGLKLPLIIQPNLFGFFAAVCFVQVLHYPAERGEEGGQHTSEEGSDGGRKVGRWKKVFGRTWVAVGMLGVCLMLLGGAEAGLYYAICAADEAGTKSGGDFVTAMGIMPTILIIGGFLPQYIDIFRTSIVDGISQPFLLMDILGAVLSLIALGLEPPPFDWLNAGSYLAVGILDVGILVLIRVYTWRKGGRGEKGVVVPEMV